MTQRKIALSIEEAADYTGIGRNTLRQLVEWKKLPDMMQECSIICHKHGLAIIQMLFVV